MRAAGFTYEEIGKEFNLSPSRARQYVVRTMGIYRHRKEKEARLNLCGKCKHYQTSLCRRPFYGRNTLAPQGCFEAKKLTNYEKVKNMSIEEMAEGSIPFFSCPYDTPYVGCAMGKKFDDDCVKCTKAWLESEAEEGQNGV